MSDSKFSWAVNQTKLAQAKQDAENEKKGGSQDEALVKEFYLQRKGLTRETEVDEEKDVVSISSMKVVDLKNLAAEKNIDISKCGNKDEILKTLAAAGIE